MCELMFTLKNSVLPVAIWQRSGDGGVILHKYSSS